MNTKSTIKLLSLLLVLCMALSSCAPAIAEITDTPNNENSENIIVDNSENVQQTTIATSKQEPEKGEYNEGIVLVKTENDINSMLSQVELTVKSAAPLYAGSTWYTLELDDEADTKEAYDYLVSLEIFDSVDLDYVMGITGPLEDKKPTDNPNYDNQVNLGLSNIPHGWTVNNKAPGGSSDVIVAVIDTGVDYNHLDLRNNIWTNIGEIPDNGKDDDGNGYIDDVYGWNCVDDNNDPMDDNGHGTHVAGIIAAENNKIGGIGVAYNCKVMVIKAGNSSGYFNNSDIAEAILYAGRNGASVINMSFGGSNISKAVEEALEKAYNTSILVAAAGNDSACNNLSCKVCDKVNVSYPAALPYVIGVMSVDKDGKHTSSFSNYDHYPYDSVEYEVYAVGEGVGSTWPSNEYACLNGTSMAAPTVAGIAALLRSYYTDREVYSTKFIQSQIVNTGTVYPHVSQLGDGHVTDEAHSVADVHEALTKLPTPSVNLYDYYIDDSVSINVSNNENGVIDSGETVRLYISLHNRGGVASNVNVTIDTDRGMGMTDPYFTFVNSEITLSDIGTYSVRESGDKYFEIIVSDDCPNDYLTDFNIRFTYENGLDEKDNTNYSGNGVAQFNVSRGYLLPATITEDTIYTADKLYIVGQDVVIPEGVTVTFEEGCEIQFYDDREYYNSPRIIVYGTLNFLGTNDAMVKIHQNDSHKTYVCLIANNGTLNVEYVEACNLFYANLSSSASSIIKNSLLRQQVNSNSYVSKYDKGSSGGTHGSITEIYDINAMFIYRNTKIYDSYIEDIAYGSNLLYYSTSTQDSVLFISPQGSGNSKTSLENSIFVTKAAGDAVFSYYSDFTYAKNNYFLAAFQEKNHCRTLSFAANYTDGNKFSLAYQQNASQIIKNYYDSTGTPVVDIYGSLSDASLLWPHIVSVEMFDKDGSLITTVGREEITVRVIFNRPMDVTQNTFLTFGTKGPYADYKINGEYISDTVWEGTYTLKAQIENGQNFLKVNNACAAEDQTKTVFGEYQLHEFTIDTTAAMSMNLQAFPTENGIELKWFQDDYDTLLGYNIYRADSKDGNYVKLNPTILLPSVESFIDENAEPGKAYWYTYKVVLTDFNESNPAGRVSATALDTMAPSMYHTPVNQGYENNNLIISCTASDNIGIDTVTLYYTIAGANQWKSLEMIKFSDKYSATIYGSDVTLAGIEYYIVASDGRNTIQKGSSEEPYFVLVKDASTISTLGDVDGDGVITTKDALMLIQCLNEDIILTDDEFKRADLNSDNKLSSVEALRILQYINGNVTTLKMN